MATTLAATGLIKPAYATHISTNRPTPPKDRSMSEDSIGPLPNIKLAIPKLETLQSKSGLPVHPSPHTRFPSDPTLQVAFGERPAPSIEKTKKTTASPPLEQRGFLTLSPLQTSPSSFDSGLTSSSTGTSSYTNASTQTEAFPSDLDCRYCRGCQRRMQRQEHRRNNSESSITSIESSSSITNNNNHQNETQEDSISKPLSFGRKFRFNVLQRSGSTAKDTKKGKGVEEESKKARRKKDAAGADGVGEGKKNSTVTRRIEFVPISPTDHWADE